MDLFCYLCFVLFFAALWSPRKRADILDLFYVMFYCVFVIFPYGVLGQVWYLIVWIHDLCLLPYFVCVLSQ